MENVQVNPMEWRAVVRFEVLLGKTPKVIHDEMVEAYKEGAPSYNFVCKWVRRFNAGRTDINDDQRSGRPRLGGAVDDVSSHLEEQPFASVRSTAQELGLAPTTVYRIFTNDLGLKKFVSHWVPHTLSDEQRHQRVELARSLLMRLEATPKTEVITADESWFYMDYSHDGRWAHTGDEVETRPKRAIGSRKIMIIVIWGVRGPLLVRCLPETRNFNTQFTIEILNELDMAVRRFRPKLGLKHLKFHWDNARPHTSSETRSRLSELGVSVLPHPPYSPDIAPSDFFLFGYIKSRLRGCSFGTSDELLGKVTMEIEAISRNQLESVFEEWKGRLFTVIETGGSYITK